MAIKKAKISDMSTVKSEETKPIEKKPKKAKASTVSPFEGMKVEFESSILKRMMELISPRRGEEFGMHFQEKAVSFQKLDKHILVEAWMNKPEKYQLHKRFKYFEFMEGYENIVKQTKKGELITMTFDDKLPTRMSFVIHDPAKPTKSLRRSCKVTAKEMPKNAMGEHASTHSVKVTQTDSKYFGYLSRINDELRVEFVKEKKKPVLNLCVVEPSGLGGAVAAIGRDPFHLIQGHEIPNYLSVSVDGNDMKKIVSLFDKEQFFIMGSESGLSVNYNEIREGKETGIHSQYHLAIFVKEEESYGRPPEEPVTDDEPETGTEE